MPYNNVRKCSSLFTGSNSFSFFFSFFFLSCCSFFFYLRKFTCSTYAVKLNANAVIQVGIFLCSDCLVLHVGSCPSYIFMCSSRLGQNKSPAPACLMRRAVPACTLALFRCHPNSKFFHSLFVTSIFSCLYGVLNVGKKITNCTV